MKWANFLHIYQPAGQQPDILESVVVQSYRPILRGILEHKKVRLTMNINGSLLELFDKHQYNDLIDMLRKLVGEGRLELTTSAKFHALLPFLEEQEIFRQIETNNETLHYYFNHGYRPIGFFPPEMAYDERLPQIVESIGFKWMILDEIAKSGKTQTVDYHKIYRAKGTNLKVFFRERRPSNLIMSAVARSYESLKEAMGKDFSSNRYLVTGMDGETFGHHRPGLEKMLFEMFESKDFELVQVSDLLSSYKDIEDVSPVKSTWASSEEDIERNVQFLSWKDPDNEIHTWQWELVNLALKSVYELSKDHVLYGEIRARMDEALASDHFWWASAKPWWSLEEIERGAYRCLGIIRRMPGIEPSIVERARVLYENIISTAFEWKRSGKIYELAKERREVLRVPFKERTFEKGGAERGVYEGFMAMFKDLEMKATKKQEYEKAIIWRDAIYKIENKNDIYDLIHAVDLLRVEIPNEEVEKMLDKYTEKYKKIRGGQPEQRD